MAAPSAAAKNTMLDALGTVAVFASLHTADPGTTGASEATGGAPAYARKAITWSAASGTKVSSNVPLFDVPAGTYAFFGLWSAASAGTYYDGGALSASEVFAGQGTYSLLSVTLTQA
jgi:hypothetical protein